MIPWGEGGGEGLGNDSMKVVGGAMVLRMSWKGSGGGGINMVGGDPGREVARRVGWRFYFMSGWLWRRTPCGA